MAPDGTFGNRFDDPDSTYRVLYASSQRLSCFLETLARFRPDLALLTELQTIKGPDDFISPATVPKEWLGSRILGSARVAGRYAAIGNSDWISFLRSRFATLCLELGIGDLDASALHRSVPRRFTQLISVEVSALGFDGIVYRSKYGLDLENWAIFEPFSLADRAVEELSATDPDFVRAVELHGLRLSD